MKYCPNCGAQLPDEANFCPKCGTKQPDAQPNNVVEEPKVQETPAPVVESAPQPARQPAQAQEPAQITPAQRYNYLKQNDERFKATVKVAFILRFLGLISLLYIIPWLVCYLVPVGTLTGIDVSDYGNNLMSASGKSFPHNFSMFEVQFVLRSWAKVGHYKLTPDDALSTNNMPGIIWYFGFVFLPLLALVAIIGNPKGFILRTYEKDPKELYKVLKNNTVWIFGPCLSIIAMVNAIVTYANCKNLDYSGGSHYFLGIIVENKAGLIAIIMVCVLFMIAMIAGSIAPRAILFNKLKKHYQ